MSRKSSRWLRPQRKGASNRAALNEANYFMEHNKVLRERIKELAAENAKLRKLVQRMWPVFIGEKRATFADRLHVRAEIDELGIEVE